jgi:biotin operon repressor
VVKHPEQAYQTTTKGIQWLRDQGIDVEVEGMHKHG